MKHNRLAVAAAILLNLAFTTGAHAVQLDIQVQGYLTNAAGTPYTTPQAAEFKLYQGGSASQAGSGTLVYDETSNITPAPSGVFTYLLGSGSPLTPALSTGMFDTNSPLYVEISVGGVVLLPRLLLTGMPFAAVAGVAQSLDPVAQVTVSVLNASSGTFAASLSAPAGITASTLTLTAAGNQYALVASTGINVTAGGVSAPFFNGAYYGDGSHLSGVGAASVGAPNIGPGTLPPGVLLPAANLINGPISPALLPANIAFTNQSNTFSGPQNIQGPLTASTMTLTGAGAGQYALVASTGIDVTAGGVISPYFSGTYYGDGSHLSGVAASIVAPSNIGAGTLGQGVLLPTNQLTGAPISPTLLVSTIAYTTQSNIFTASQTVQGVLAVAPQGNAVVQIGGSYPGPGSGYSGDGQVTSQHSIIFPSWSQVAPVTDGVKLVAVNKTAYATSPWYLFQSAELHLFLLGHGALTPDDTTDLYDFTPTGFLAAQPINAPSANLSFGLSAATITLTGTGSNQYALVASTGIDVTAGGVTAPYFSGAHYGDGSGLTGITATAIAPANILPGIVPSGVGVPPGNILAGPLGPSVQVPPANILPGTLPSGVVLPTTQLTGPPISPALLVSTLPYTTNANTFGPVQTFSGGLTATNATMTFGVTAATLTLTGGNNNLASLNTSSGIAVAAGGVTAPYFSGAFVGSGAGLTQLPTSSLVGGPIAQSLFPPTVALGNALKANLNVKNDAATPLTTVDITADLISVQGVSLSNVSVSANTGLSGVPNGLDSGSLSNGTWYAVFVITNNQGTQIASLLSLATAPSLPAGYTRFRRVGWVNINGSSNITQFQNVGDWWYWTDAAQFIYSNPSGTTSLARAVPPTSKIASWAESGYAYVGGILTVTPTGSVMPATAVGGQWTNEDGSLQYGGSGTFLLNASQQVNINGASRGTLVVLGYYDPL